MELAYNIMLFVGGMMSWWLITVLLIPKTIDVNTEVVDKAVEEKVNEKFAAINDALDQQFSANNDKLNALYMLLTRNGKYHIADALRKGPENPTVIGGAPVAPEPRMVMKPPIENRGEGVGAGDPVVTITAGFEKNIEKLQKLVVKKENPADLAKPTKPTKAPKKGGKK